MSDNGNDDMLYKGLTRVILTNVKDHFPLYCLYKGLTYIPALKRLSESLGTSAVRRVHKTLH